MSTILVIGAHGNVGAPLARQLAAEGHIVRRATSRAPEQADQVRFDAVTGEGRAQALAGVDAAFLLTPPGYPQHDTLINPVVDEAVRQGVRHVVLMSAMGADADPTAPLRRAELHLERSGLSWNVIRPNWFMQNFNTFWLHGIQTQGQILLPVGRAKGSFIDVRDIAATAAALLTRREHAGQAFDLTGPEALDHDQAAALISRATGRRIGYTEIAPETLRQGLLAAGLPADYTEFLLLILGYFKAGHAERTTDAVQRLTGQAPRSFEVYARDYRAAWV